MNLKEKINMSSDRPLVSIVVCSYNYAYYIGQTIASVLAQTYDNWELIISDDGSTDTSIEVIRSFSDPRITVIASESNRGGAVAYAEAYKLCRGKYFTSLDSDDYIVPSKLEKQVQYFEDHPDIDILSTFVTEVDASGQIIGDQGVHQIWFNQKMDLNQPDSWLWQNHLCHSSALIRKAFHDQIGLTNPNLPYTADYEFWVRCLIGGGRFHVLPEKLTYYRAHRDMVTHQNPDRALLESAYVFCAHLKPYLFKINRHDLAYKGFADLLNHHEPYQKASKQLKAKLLKQLLCTETGPKDFECFLENAQSPASTEFLTLTEVLDKALIAIQESTKLNEQQQGWMTELEKGKSWLEEERQKWRDVASEQGAHIQRQQAAIEQQQATIQQQQGWMTELEKGKSWLEGEWQKWRDVASEQGAHIQRQQAAIEQQQVWMTELEKGKSWLEGEWQKWRDVASEQGAHIQRQQAAMDRQQATIQQQQVWMTELEKGKSWLEGEWQKWRDVASEQGAHIQRQQAAIEQQQATIQGLEEYLIRLRQKPLIRFGQYFGLLGPDR